MKNLKNQKGEAILLIMAILFVVGGAVSEQADDSAGNCMPKIEACNK